MAIKNVIVKITVRARPRNLRCVSAGRKLPSEMSMKLLA